VQDHHSDRYFTRTTTAWPSTRLWARSLVLPDHEQIAQITEDLVANVRCAAALLRWIHVVITRRVTWDPAVAAAITPLQQAA
jgi:hypothetical protein